VVTITRLIIIQFLHILLRANNGFGRMVIRNRCLPVSCQAGAGTICAGSQTSRQFYLTCLN
jgi:hypothetical protein